ncbi:MAG: hypothetical protein K2Q18_08865 [Bdellovibrionales bacterium]|nr:hypothetical protein [Bdellovibrionales bacterium]
MKKTFLILSLFVVSLSAFSQEVLVSLTGKKYGVPTGHVQVINPRIKFDYSYEEKFIKGDLNSAFVACDILDMNYVSYKYESVESAVSVVSFNSDKDINVDDISNYIISSLHCSSRDKK